MEFRISVFAVDGHKILNDPLHLKHRNCGSELLKIRFGRALSRWGKAGTVGFGATLVAASLAYILKV